MTRYSNTATPIRTPEELDAAIEAGAQFEYTACGNDYDDPKLLPGWIADETPQGWREDIAPGADTWWSAGFQSGIPRLRAFYPESDA